jgi:hypothetical protein
MWGPNEDKHPILVCPRPLEQLTPWVHAAQYSKILVEEKTQNMPVWISKMVLAQHFLAEDAETGKKAQQSLTPALLDWLDGLIGPSGLLLLISQSLFQFYR